MQWTGLRPSIQPHRDPIEPVREIGVGGVGHGYFAGAGGAACASVVFKLTAASWAWRDMSMDSPRMRASSCGAWKPMEFSASS